MGHTRDTRQMSLPSIIITVILLALRLELALNVCECVWLAFSIYLYLCSLTFAQFALTT